MMKQQMEEQIQMREKEREIEAEMRRNGTYVEHYKPGVRHL